MVALFMGSIGTHAIAAHQIAISLASFSFMMPLGVSMAAAVRVGQAIGRADMPGMRRAAHTSLCVGAAIMLLWGTIFYSMPRLFAALYTNQPELIALAGALIQIAALFQVFDGLQVVSIGILRGMGDTRTPMVVNVVGFYALALPLSYVLGFGLGHGERGLWWGLVAGLAVVAAILLARVRRQLGGEHARIAIDR